MSLAVPLPRSCNLDFHRATCAFPRFNRNNWSTRRQVMADAKKESGRMGAGGGAPPSGSLHRYRSHTCGALRKGDIGRRAPVGLGAPRARPRRPAVHRPARPLRPDPGRRRSRQPRLQDGRDGALRVGDPRRRPRARPPRGHRQRRAADRRGRAVRHRDRGAVGGQGVAGPGVRRARLPRRPAAAVPLPRSAARDAAQEHHAAQRDHRLDPPAHARESASSSSRRRSSPPPRPRARATSWCPRACIRASSTRCRRRRSSSSS